MNSNVRHLGTDHSGKLTLDSESAARLAIAPGNRVIVEDDGNGLHIWAAGRLGKLYVEATSECNLGCRTCVRNTWNERTGKMPEAVFSRVLEGLSAFVMPVKIVFGGFGEPLSHPHIASMVSRAKGIGATVEMITNGTLLTREMSGALIAAGLDCLWVSLDGATPQSYDDIRLGATFSRVMSNISVFNDLVSAENTVLNLAWGAEPRTRLGIVFVAMKRNFSDLPAVISLGRKFNADRFMVTNVIPYSKDLQHETLYSRALDDVTYFPLSLPRTDLDEQNEPAMHRAIRGAGGTWPGNAPGLSPNRCAFIDGGAGAITWNGDLSPCLPLLHSHSIHLTRAGREKRDSRRWAVGNVLTESLYDLWNRPEHIAFRERVKQFEFPPCTVCVGCDLAEKNEDDCYGNSFPTCGGCLWAQGVVQCP